MNVSGPVTIVTGGTFGLGRSVALELARRGHSIVALGLDARQESSLAENGIETLNAEFADAGLKGVAISADVSNQGAIEAVVADVLAKQGHIDGLVNNAAIGPLGTVLDTDERLWDRIMAVNLKGPYNCARAVIPHMARNGGGAIVNVGSGAGWGKPNMAAYAASKGGLFALSAALAYDHFHQHIRVNTVVPGGGGIVTGMSLGRVDGDLSRIGRSAPGTAAGRVMTGRDLASTIAFLLSAEAEAISGTVIDIGCFAHQGGPIPPQSPAPSRHGLRA
jgi:NAD(P)-dependent dehydrogenase (short-subunit alcohol dehydrogenase family)